MSPLAGAVLSLLDAEADYPPMSSAKVIECLRVTGRCPEGRPPTVQEIEAALAELIREGKAEGAWRGGTRCYRALDSRQVGGVKAL